MKQSKKLGQCFLKDKNFVKKAIKSADITENDIVLEVGLGEGALTKELAKLAKFVYVIELDMRLEPFANQIMSEFKNVKVIWNDALKVDLKELGFNKIVANLPYQISSPITFKFLENDFDVAVLMYQYEFAKRMIGKPDTDEYSRLSVSIQYNSDVEFICKVPPTAFSPKPDVNSAIVKLTKREPLFHIENEEFFRNVLNAIFQHRNRTVKRALIDSSHEMNIERERLKEILENIKLDFDFSERVFKLAPEKIGELSNILYLNIISKK
ncbi:dimethyladenosine transferase [Methanococcus vannielii SB]|uniref:Probable ribosomal RNA small subunit methyltransferase A n=2 Tax=Methanococcus TaxID=2184 RepID=RSMA_METVS|nr:MULTISPECIES: 16S rRNA (adenine(1518)-N(6)/adenine(1519)-N(6))-dimethyltransferase RsmA [Methanococcus]A6UP00.1 RecName: Full=Probable ribosomal RNA small subunit methyltransferase A; AltName: Full=16S rRNA dimethyladenosine transferase; AltName: Full=16S rRNA dimethylase; AltName: Full=S-adenosylmethionine-6-N',N'-adenosyl(rRNA) dimethyltransferase [Methanococcus vannielii SB]ABR54222.1 dimethyladenosine transferase [Methanococcus vannielii SB]AEK20017.1 16S ribosomal RNA methyltransferase K